MNCLRGVFKITFLERVLVAATQGKSQFSAVGRLTPNNYQYQQGSIRKATRNGIVYQFDLSDKVDWYNYFGFEEEDRNNFFKQLKSGMIVLDVGANMGEFSLKTAQKIGVAGRVFSFEPDPVNFKRLENNIQLNPNLASRINAYNFGLGNIAGRMQLAVVNRSNLGMNRITHVNVDVASSAEIEIKTLNEFAPLEKIESIHWIKIDVEGFELKVLKGATEIIKKFRPSLFIELGDNNLREQGDSAPELIAWLESMNYEVTHSISGVVLNRAEDYSNLQFDVFALPN